MACVTTNKGSEAELSFKPPARGIFSVGPGRRGSRDTGSRRRNKTGSPRKTLLSAASAAAPACRAFSVEDLGPPMGTHAFSQDFGFGVSSIP